MATAIKGIEQNSVLQTTVEQVAEKYFMNDAFLVNNGLGGFPFKGRASYNKRLKKTRARLLFITKLPVETWELQFSPVILKDETCETLIGVIKHELAHYYLEWMKTQKGEFPTAHNSKAFKYFMQVTGGLATPPLWLKPIYIYHCQHCNVDIELPYRLTQRRGTVQTHNCPDGSPYGFLKFVKSI